MAETGTQNPAAGSAPARLKKSDRRRQILLELKMRPHVRISELAQRFNVSTETLRRDFDALADEGLVSRDYGGVSAPVQGHYPGLDERTRARTEERQRIGRRAASLVREGETLMIDSGSTTIQMARALAYRGTRCTVITNSLQVAMIVGHGRAQVILCPGEYAATESAVVGAETLEFLARYHVDRCMIGASALTVEGPSESVRGFASVKRTMLQRAARRHLLIDSEKFGRKGLTSVSALDQLDSIVVDREPAGDLLGALVSKGVRIDAADEI